MAWGLSFTRSSILTGLSRSDRLVGRRANKERSRPLLVPGVAMQLVDRRRQGEYLLLNQRIAAAVAPLRLDNGNVVRVGEEFLHAQMHPVFCVGVGLEQLVPGDDVRRVRLPIFDPAGVAGDGHPIAPRKGRRH